MKWKGQKRTCSQTAQPCSHCAFGWWISAALRQQNAAQSGEAWERLHELITSKPWCSEGVMWVSQCHKPPIFDGLYHPFMLMNGGWFIIAIPTLEMFMWGCHSVGTTLQEFAHQSHRRSSRQDCAFYFHFTDSDGSKSPGSPAKELCLIFSSSLKPTGFGHVWHQPSVFDALPFISPIFVHGIWFSMYLYVLL